MNIADALAIVEKKYPGALSPVTMSSTEQFEDILFRESGCAALNWVGANHSNKGGIARGRVYEVSGPEGSGKTTLAVIIASHIQKYKERNIVIYLDFENKMDLGYAIQLGLDPAKTLFFQPRGVNAGLAGMKLVTLSVNADDCGMIIVDSIVAVVSKEEMEGELDDANIGALARLQSRTLKKVANNIHAQSPTVLLINQLRDNIGGYGASEKTPGARAIKFNSAVRLDIRAIGKITGKDDSVIGQRIKIKAVKNQTGRPFGVEEIDMYFGEGYDNLSWILDKCEEMDIIKTAAKNKDEPTGYKFQLTEDSEPIRIPKNEMNSWLAIKKNFKALYQCLIETHSKVLRDQELRRLASRKSKAPLKELKEKKEEVSSEVSSLEEEY